MKFIHLLLPLPLLPGRLCLAAVLPLPAVLLPVLFFFLPFPLYEFIFTPHCHQSPGTVFPAVPTVLYLIAEILKSGEQNLMNL